MNFATSSGIGAAALAAHCTWSRPSSRRRNARIASSALANASSTSGVIALPYSWACVHARPAAIASVTSFWLAGSGSSASLAEMPVLIFSQTRGTPKKAVGCTSPSAPRRPAGSGIACTWLPRNGGAYVARMRSAMCASGR